VATFNVRRFFDTVCESTLCGPDDYEEQPTAEAFDARAAQLADAIRALDPDVISLQEIETQVCLDALLARIGDVMPYGVLGEISTTASVDVAVLSRAPLDMVIGHRASEPLLLADGTTFSRELLEVHTRSPNGVEMILFATHFKSKSGDEPLRRLAEAQVAARVVNDVAANNPAAIVLLAGDLNDTPGSPPLDALTIDGGLLRLADDLPLAAQATYFYSGLGQSIDHILLAPGHATTRVMRSSRAWRDHGGWGGSDHSALTTELRVPDAI
jgi:endonuclease/exonuclease/phosphatase family metal-dependent hydrolase